LAVSASLWARRDCWHPGRAGGPWRHAREGRRHLCPPTVLRRRAVAFVDGRNTQVAWPVGPTIVDECRFRTERRTLEASRDIRQAVQRNSCLQRVLVAIRHSRIAAESNGAARGQVTGAWRAIAADAEIFIEISNPLVQYSESLAPYAGRTWPFLKIELELRERLQIEDPTLSGLCGFGQSAFKICVERGHGYLFGFDIDGDPKRKGTAMLAFVENTIAHNLAAMIAVTGAFNRSSQTTWGHKQQACAPLGSDELSQYDMNLLNAKVRYAPPRTSDDTSYVTTRMSVRLGLHENLVNSAVIEASGKPPTYPEMQGASIVIPALNRLTGQDPQMSTEVMIAPLFRQVGFDAPGAATMSNESEVFLSLQTPVAMSFSGKGERAGAVGTPNMNAHFLSRSVGLMGQTAQVLHTSPSSAGLSQLASGASSKVSFSGSDLFSPDAKLLGVLKLADLCEVLDLKEVPHFIESARHQVDAAGEDIGIKICQFVSASKPVLADVLHDLATELAKYKSLLPLQEHLQEFGSAINAISCTGKLDVAIAVEQIAVAGGALEKARRFVENLMQNPALLLPTDITSLITKWLKLVADLELAYRDLRDGVEQQLALLKAEIIAAVREIEAEAGAAVSVQLNRACAELVDYLYRLVTLVLPPDQQVELLYGESVIAVSESLPRCLRLVSGTELLLGGL